MTFNHKMHYIFYLWTIYCVLIFVMTARQEGLEGKGYELIGWI